MNEHCIINSEVLSIHHGIITYAQMCTFKCINGKVVVTCLDEKIC